LAAEPALFGFPPPVGFRRLAEPEEMRGPLHGAIVTPGIVPKAFVTPLKPKLQSDGTVEYVPFEAPAVR
jgi:hypothetical protein